MFCREQVAQLRHEVEEIHRRGAELVVVGNGNRHFADAFREDLNLTTPLYVDTTRESYRALGMKRPLLAFLKPALFRNAWRALRTGSRQKGIQGDPWQLGGVLIVRPDGGVAFRYLSDVAGDHPRVKDVLNALG